MFYVARISASRARERKLSHKQKQSVLIWCLVGFKLLTLLVPTCCCSVLLNLLGLYFVRSGRCNDDTGKVLRLGQAGPYDVHAGSSGSCISKKEWWYLCRCFLQCDTGRVPIEVYTTGCKFIMIVQTESISWSGGIVLFWEAVELVLRY